MRRQRDDLALLVPPEPMTVTEWADRYRKLSPKGAAEPGQWRTSRAPYLAEVMDSLSASASYTDIYVCKGAQLGFTEVGLNFILWTVDCDPGPVMVVQPTLDMVKRLVKQKLDPAIQECPSVRAKIPPPRSKDGGNSLFAKDFPGGGMFLAGANSATSLRSASIKRLFCDEVDAYPGDLDGEGDPLDLAKARTRTYPRATRFYNSTPTIKGGSRIEQGLEETDQRKYFVPCPHCDEMQLIDWSRIEWDPDDLSKPVYLVCEHNGCVIEEHHKTKMLAGGRWIATAPEKASPTKVGFHISSLYSPHGWYSWTEARDDYIRAKGKPSLMKTFVNTSLGESYREEGDSPPWRVLYNRSRGGEYKAGTIPMGGILLTAGADVQRDRIEVELRAWGRRDESWSVDYFVFEGDTARLDGDGSPWPELDKLMARSFKHESGREVRIERLGIDSGYLTQTVYSWARGHDRRRVAAMKGVETQRAVVGIPTAVDVSFRGKRLRRGLRLWPVGVGTVKGELYAWLRQQGPGENERPPIGWTHFPEYGEEYFKQLCAEEMIAKTTRNGYTKYVWQKHRERNEALDCAVYARAAAVISGIALWTERDWVAAEKSLGLPLRAGETPPPTGEQAPKKTPPPAPKKRSKKKKRKRDDHWARRRAERRR